MCEVVVFIGVGSNIEPARHVAAALVAIRSIGRVDGLSTCYWTEALGPDGDPARGSSAPADGRLDPARSSGARAQRYLNAVWRARTCLTAPDLRSELRQIEARLGRRRTGDRYAPRTIDLDLLLYGDRVIDEPGLRIPDPDIRRRPFLAYPLLELDPRLVLPDTSEPLAALAGPLDRHGLCPEPALTDQLRRLL